MQPLHQDKLPSFSQELLSIAGYEAGHWGCQGLSWTLLLPDVSPRQRELWPGTAVSLKRCLGE